MYGLYTLAIRITGIIIGLYAIKTGASFIYTASTTNETYPHWIPLTSSVLMFGAALCMVLFPSIVAGKIIPQSTVVSKRPSLTSDEVELLAYSLIGLYFLVEAVLDISYMISLWYATKVHAFPWSWTPEHVATTVSIIFELIIAIWLLFGGRALKLVMKWGRKASLNPDL